MAHDRLHRMCFSTVTATVVFLCFPQCQRTAPSCCSKLPSLELNPSSKEANPVQEAPACESKPHVTRRVYNRMRGYRVLLCLRRIQNLLPQLLPPTSSQLEPNPSMYLHKTPYNTGKNGTRYTNMGHARKMSACQSCFPVSAPIRFSLCPQVQKWVERG